MAALAITLLLCLNILYVKSYVENPIESWSEPMIFKYQRVFSLDYLPRTSDAAITKGWKPVQGLGHPKDVDVYCPPDDKTLCTLHDKNERIIGIMLSVSKDDMYTSISPYRYYESPWFKLRTISSKQYYTLDLFFVSQDHLDDPGRGAPFTSVGETFRIIDKKGNSTEVPIDEVELFVDGWEKQNCEVKKGTHYLHKIEDAGCKDFLPIVMLVKNKEVVGFSFIIPGSYSGKFFQTIKSTDFTRLFPNAPQCLKSWASSYKISALYVTFTPIRNMKKCETDDHDKPPSSWRRGISGLFNGK